MTVNETETPLLLPYQAAWVADRSPVKVCVKSRQIGITWATAYEAVETAAPDDGMDFWYQTVSADDAREFIEDVAMWTRLLESACQRDDFEMDMEEAHEWLLLPEGERSIKVTSVRFASGNRVSSIAHSPRKLRGKRGVLCLDEAAYHENLPAILKAGHAFRVWGGRLIFISTQDTVENPFNQLVEDIANGVKDNAVYSLHSYTIHQAVDAGLYKRICEVAGERWSEEKQKAFVWDLLSSDGADSEFLCLPMRSGGQYIPGALVEACWSGDYQVLRLALDDKFLFRPESEKTAFITDWYKSVVAGRVSKLSGAHPHYFGSDFGRVSDLSVYAIGHTTNGVLHVPIMIELSNVPFDQQRQLFFLIAAALPRLTFVALDGAGNGAPLGEAAVVHFGESMCESVKANDTWYGSVLPVLKSRFEDREILVPKDLDIRQDLGRFELINGVPKLPRTRTRAVRMHAAQNEKRHADAGIALAMLSYAAGHAAAEGKYRKVERRTGMWAQKGAI